jgi:hypothetical protein
LARLKSTLARVSVPRLGRVITESELPRPSSPTAPGRLPEAVPSAPPVLRISGENLLRGTTPVVRLRGQPIPVLRATPQEIVVLPNSNNLSGTLALELEPGVVLETELSDLVAPANAEAPAVSPSAKP